VTRTWLAGLLRRRPGSLAATAAGVAVAVALLASLGAFLAASKSSMTARAARGVAVDWQVQIQPGADPAAVARAVRSAPGVTATATVGFARTSGLSASTGGSVQQTGPGVVLGLPAGYRATFPGELRTLTGSATGVLLAQQTAANLRAGPGDTVHIGRAGLPAVAVTVDGVVELPQADSLFQTVGAPAGAQPTAPPDNVLLLPDVAWRRVFDPLATARPDLVTRQLHTARSHALPPDPASAYTAVTGAARNLEAATSGAGVVGDNLGAALGAARQDAAYAQVLFLFLGLPGAVLAALLTAALTSAGRYRRRREQALLRGRGATTGQLGRLAAAEAAIVGVAGSVGGLTVALAAGRLALGSARFGASTGQAAAWTSAAVAAGLLVAVATVLLPARRDARALTVQAGRATIGARARRPTWARYGLDVAALAASGAVFWAAGRSGYALVLAPEGVPSISVSYWAFAGPALLWAGAALLALRLTDVLLGPGRRLVGRLLRPVAGGLAPTVAATMSRQRGPLARSVVLLALAVAFALSTATFNATYRAQAEVDARLSNGADVTVTEPPGATVQPGQAARLATVPGVRSVETIQHRFAYVGADLQDLYGVHPATITAATLLQDAYFQGGTAAGLMARLAASPDSVLVSAETVKDFQLTPGDRLTLRLRNGRTGALTPVRFHYAGVAKEFPTAPKDSFLVANADYVARATADDAVGAFLLDTGGRDTAAVADRVRTLLGPAAAVTDITGSRAAVGSSLTAVDLAGLTRLELAFALVLAVASGGLVLALGLAERRRSFAIAAAVGATGRQLRRLVAAETAVVATSGLVAGAGIGAALSWMLVTVLTGVFDPPPDALTVPWGYLIAVAAATIAALAAAAVGTAQLAARSPLPVLREL
jgi:putative ABC transport system permease protein